MKSLTDPQAGFTSSSDEDVGARRDDLLGKVDPIAALKELSRLEAIDRVRHSLLTERSEHSSSRVRFRDLKNPEMEKKKKKRTVKYQLCISKSPFPIKDIQTKSAEKQYLEV